MRSRLSLPILITLLCAGPAAFAQAGHGKSIKWYAENAVSPRLGVQVLQLTDELRTFFGAQRDAGVLVGKVEPQSPAAQAGVRVGDVLVSVSGQKVGDAMDVRQALSAHKEGDLVEVTVIRDRRPTILSAKVPRAERAPAAAFPGGEMRMPDGESLRMFGMAPDLDDKLEKLDDRLDRIEQRLDKIEKK